MISKIFAEGTKPIKASTIEGKPPWLAHLSVLAGLEVLLQDGQQVRESRLELAALHLHKQPAQLARQDTQLHLHTHT